MIDGLRRALEQRAGGAAAGAALGEWRVEVKREPNEDPEGWGFRWDIVVIRAWRL